MFQTINLGRAEVVENILTKDAVHPDTTIKSGKDDDE